MPASLARDSERAPFGRIIALRRVAQHALPFAVGASFFALNYWRNERRLAYQIDADEGYALIQALLVGRGHALYWETFSDQPPGYTYLLLAFTRTFGETPEVARLLTLVLVSAWLAALHDLCRRSFSGWPGHLGGLVACSTLALSQDFLRYSCAAMIGLPAICLAGAATWTFRSKPSARARLVSRGGLLALSLWVKPLCAPLVPIFWVATVWEALQSSTTGSRGKVFRVTRLRRALKDSIPFFAAFLGTFAVGFIPVLFSPGRDMIFGTHRLHTDEPWPGWPAVDDFLTFDSWFLAPALVLGVLLVWRRNGAAIFAACCVVFATVSLSLYSPVWSHHRYLILVPASALLGLGIGQLGSWFQKGDTGKRFIIACIFVASIGSSIATFPHATIVSIHQDFDGQRKPSRILRKVEQLRRLAPKATLMATSEQMLAYRLGIEVPPRLAMTSRKRFKTGQLGSKKLTEWVLEADPDIIALNRRWPKNARRRIEKGVRRTHERAFKNWKDFAIYLRRD